MEKREGNSEKRWLAANLAVLSVFLLMMTASVILVSRQNKTYAEELQEAVCAYLLLATEEEYDQIADTIRHDLIYRQGGQEIERLAEAVPNTSGTCCLAGEVCREQVNLVFLNTGEAYGLDIYNQEEPLEAQKSKGGMELSFGYDEISGTQLTVQKEPNKNAASAMVHREREIVSVHKMKARFCDSCIGKMLDAVQAAPVEEAVLYDAAEKKFYPITEGTLEIGNYRLEITGGGQSYQIALRGV